MKLKQYPKYKDSDIPWVGNIPNHWVVNRAKWYIKSPKELNNNEQCKDVLSLTLRGVVDNNPDNPEGLVPKDYKTYQIFDKDDLVFKLIDLENIRTSRVGLVHKRGIMSPAYIRAVTKDSNEPSYFYYLYYSWYLQNVYNKLGAGVRATLSSKDLLDLKILIPPVDEQKLLVAYLRSKEKKIAKFIRNKRRLIQLLKEQKQAIINQAVTRGINPDVKLKPSGVDWLGDIPEHWDVRRLRTVAFVRPSGVDKNIVDGEIPVRLCNYVDVYKNERITDSMEFMNGTATQEEINKFQLKEGDVLVTKDSEMWNDIAVPAYIPETLSGVICAYHLAVVRPLSMNGEFLFRAFLAESVADQFRVTANGVTRYGLSQGAIKDAWFPIPPKEEQNEIVDYINDNVSKIHLAIEKANKEIDLIQEYRTRLISDVVTGKVDVRDVKVEDVTDLPVRQAGEEITDDLDLSEDEQEPGDSVEEVLDEE